MSIASAISNAQAKVAAAYAACNDKGAVMPVAGSQNLSNLATTISSISGGGGSEFDDWVKDGDTHLWIDIVNEYQLEQQILVRMVGTIDWGDGTNKDSINITTNTVSTHTYTNLGRYRIDLHPTSGNFYLGGASTSYSVMGGRTSAQYFRASALYQAEVGSSIITSLGSYAFYYCYGLKRAYISKGITSLGSNNFFNCYGLSSVIFEDPSKITSATLNGNFYYCYALQYITPLTIPSGVTALTYPVRNCQSLAEFTIPSPITSIAANTFANTYGMKILHCLPSTAPTVASSDAFSSFPTTCVIEVPFGSLTSYQSASYWSDRASQMVEAGKVTYTLSHVVSSNMTAMVSKNSSYTTTLEAESGYTLGTVTVNMGGVNITSTAYSAGVVTIADVTGNIEITATAS